MAPVQKVTLVLRVIRAGSGASCRSFFGAALLLGLASTLGWVVLGTASAAAEGEPVPSFIDTPTPVPEAPTEKQIKRAVMRCLSSSDTSQVAARRNPRGLGAAEEGEERYCFDQKRECLKDPVGFACRSFIRDYVPE